MATPKKKVSKSKTKTRLAKWKAKGSKMAKRALSLGKSIINKKSKFLFDAKKKEPEDKNLNDDVDKITNDNSDNNIDNDLKK
uniref:50S ribosomal protein L32 n=1 Tax=Sporochnus bolleanus TaxID=461143 RepID=UPI002E773C95|nr:50S ribosomal protein L32 [Sporochnus bolleanus]WAM64862.1 50S ribosomal protein L32 [Sporochnus bolleanus]